MITLPYTFDNFRSTQRAILACLCILFAVLACALAVAFIQSETEFYGWLGFSALMFMATVSLAALHLIPTGQITRDGVTLNYLRFWSSKKIAKTEHYPISAFSSVMLLKNDGYLKNKSITPSQYNYSLGLIWKERPGYLFITSSAAPNTRQQVIALADAIGLPVEELTNKVNITSVVARGAHPY